MQTYPRLVQAAHFSNTRYRPTAEKIDARYPLHLNTGRLRDQWHGMSRAGLVPQLFNHVEEPLISMQAADMARREIADGDLVKVSSRRGSLVLRAQSSEEMLPSQTFIPMHWGSQYMHGAGCNGLTIASFDPVSKQPEFKHAAVKVEKIGLPWQIVAMRRNDQQGLLQNIRGLLDAFEYASCGLYGRDPGIVLLRAAHSHAPPAELIEQLDTLFQMTDDSQTISYQDARRGISKRIVVENGEPIGLRLLGETLAVGWLKEVMVQGRLTDELRRWALAPLSAPPAGGKSRGRIVCNCLDISDAEIREELAHGADLSTLQRKLKCGTECGSCVSELKRIMTRH